MTAQHKSNPATWAGFSFALHLLKIQGFYFCLAAIQTHTSVYSVFCVVHAESYTAHATKQRTGLYRGFSCDCVRSAAHDTKPTQQAIAQPATRWSAYQRPDALHRYQIPTPRRTPYRSAQPPYYNKVYKGAPLLWIHASRCSISQTMPVQQQERGGRRETIDGYRRSSFRAFAR